MPDATAHEWWIAVLGDKLIWACLRLHDSGLPEVFDCDGRTLVYDDESAARMALLDADFRAWNGLDESDADALGFDLGSLSLPDADNDVDLARRMIQEMPPRQ